jgi:protein subunit release factor A
VASAAEAVGGWRERVRAARERRDALAAQLADPAVLGDPERLKKLAREHAELEALAEAGARLEKLEGERAQAREVIGTETDAEFVALAESEIEALDAQIAELRQPSSPPSSFGCMPATRRRAAGASRSSRGTRVRSAA